MAAAQIVQTISDPTYGGQIKQSANHALILPGDDADGTIAMTFAGLSEDLTGTQSSPSVPGFPIGAVAFDGLTSITNPSLTVPTPNPYMSGSFWYYLTTFPALHDQMGLLVNHDFSFQFTFANGSNHSGQGNFIEIDSPGPNYNYDVEAYWDDTRIGAWHNIMWACDISTNATTIYVDNALVTQNANTGVPGPENIDLGGIPFSVVDIAEGYNGYLADLWLAPGVLLDLSDATVRAKFINASGKPVDLGATGATPTGTAPAIFLHIDPMADPTTFSTNKGTGGNFTSVVGALTTAPSAPPT